MPSTDKPEATVEATKVSLLSLTWRFTQTYTGHVPLAVVAAATGYGVYEIAADPGAVLGGAGHDLTSVLMGQQAEDWIVGEPEIEITGADYASSATLPELVDAALQALYADTGTDHHSVVAQALAALLAGLRRDGVTDRCANNGQDPDRGAVAAPGQVPA